MTLHGLRQNREVSEKFIRFALGELLRTEPNSDFSKGIQLLITSFEVPVTFMSSDVSIFEYHSIRRFYQELRACRFYNKRPNQLLDCLGYLLRTNNRSPKRLPLYFDALFEDFIWRPKE